MSAEKRKQYQAWIDENIKETRGKCATATRQMQEAFPELTRVRGHYYCPVWGERQHWWLTDEEGQIVDPTKEQFPSHGRGGYEPWIEGSPEPTGRCPNCGELIYDGRELCSEECHRSYAAFCMQGLW